MSIAMLMQTATPVAIPDALSYMLSPSEVFMLFFIMLGPIKIIGPYFLATREMEAHSSRRLAFKVFALASIAVLTAGLLGSSMMQKWHVTVTVMQLCGGLIFLLAALQMVLSQYKPPAAGPVVPEQPGATFLHLVFPVTVPPYGVAAVITLMAMSTDRSRFLMVMGLALLVMVTNLAAMLAVKPIMRWVGMVPLQILGAVLGVLQVALALQMLVSALQVL